MGRSTLLLHSCYWRCWGLYWRCCRVHLGYLRWCRCCIMYTRYIVVWRRCLRMLLRCWRRWMWQSIIIRVVKIDLYSPLIWCICVLQRQFNVQVYRESGVAWKRMLIKLYRVSDKLLSHYWVPACPAFIVSRVSNEHALLGVQLELFSLVFLDVHIGSASKNVEMRDI